LLVSSLFVSGSAGGRGRRSCGFHNRFDSHPVLHRSRVSSSIAVISPHFPGAADLCSFCRAVSVKCASVDVHDTTQKRSKQQQRMA
jgi:hypothetical protein